MLEFHSNSVLQTTDHGEKNWSLSELLEHPNPLVGETLSDRNQAMRQVVDIAMDYYSELSAIALLRYDFWKQLLPQRIESQQFDYQSETNAPYSWQLTVNKEGLFYKDISGAYSPPGTVHEQLFSDFWFYGPCMPIPDLYTRKLLVAKIRNAFLQAGSSASYKHFPLFEYASIRAASPNQWITGNHSVVWCDFGVEIVGSLELNGPTPALYLSFENLMEMPNCPHQILTDNIRNEIGAFLKGELIRLADEEALSREPDRDEADPPKTTSRFDELAPFIATLKSTTQKSLEDWLELMKGSPKRKFLEVRKWLQDNHQLDTKTATNLAMLYDQYLEDITPVVWVYSSGRGGTIGYKGPEGAFDTDWEFGGNSDTLAIIFLPSAENWFVETGIPTVHRAKVLQTFGRLVVDRQTNGKGSFELEGNCMLIFAGKKSK